MKKMFAAMMLLVILTLSLGMAQAEIGAMHVKTLRSIENADYEIDESGNKHYYVSMVADSRGYSVKREVSRTVYYELLAEEQADQEYYDNLWYVKPWNWTTTAAHNVVDFVVFWK